MLVRTILASTILVLSTAAHECIHDAIQREVKLEYITLPKSEHAAPTAIAPIRIVMSVGTLYDPSRYCTAAGETRVSYADSSTITCTAAGVLTEAKRQYLVNTILPEVQVRLARAISVEPIPLHLCIPPRICDRDFTVSAAEQAGVKADFVLVVSGMQTAGFTIAFAAACIIRYNDGRPVVGISNIGPNHIDPNEKGDTTVRVMTHEVLHALGFSNYFWSNYYPSGTLIFKRRRGGPVIVAIAPPVMTAARQYFGCAELAGPEIENEGGSGTAGSHWKRRSQMEDLMAGIMGKGRFSTMTLAMLEASGYYTANYSSAESMEWGNGRGCGFFISKCNTRSGGAGIEFCDGASGEQCTFDRRGYGRCEVDTYGFDLPVYQRYFPGEPRKGGRQRLMDYCPIVSANSNAHCDDSTSSTNNVIFAEYFGEGGRCIETSTKFIQSPYPFAGSFPRRCMRVRCPGGTRVEIELGSTWVQCPLSGTSATLDGAPYGYTGTFTCPSTSDICDPSLTVSDTLTTTTATTAGSTTTDTTTTATTTTDTTTTTSTIPTTTDATTTYATAATTTGPPTTTTAPGPSPPVVVLLRLVLRIFTLTSFNFSDFVDTSMNATKAEGAKKALTADLAAALGVPKGYIKVVAVTVGSLDVKYEVVVPADEALAMGAETLSTMQSQVADRSLGVTPAALSSLTTVLPEDSGDSSVRLTSTSSSVLERPNVESSLAGLSPPSDNGLSTGAIAGIVVGSVLGGILVIMGVVALVARARRSHAVVAVRKPRKKGGS